MSSYDRLKVSELRQLCDERGLQHAGMKKARLIQTLRDNDGDNDNDFESVAASDVEGSDAEEEIGGDAYVADDDGGGSGVGAAIAPPAGDGDESEAITVLRLKLALAAEERAARAEERAARAEEFEREQHRAAMQPRNDLRRPHFEGSNDVKNLLPIACVILMHFRSFYLSSV